MRLGGDGRGRERGRALLGRIREGSDTWHLLVKCTLAATLSWWIAADVLSASAASFAPFSAILLVYGTVPRSVYHGIRYAGGMVVGIALAGAVTPMLSPGVGTFALIVLIALILGQWRRLGSHGWQVPVAVMFAYQYIVTASNLDSAWSQLALLCGLVLLGSAVGLAVNVVFPPPLYYRSTEHNVRRLGNAVADLLGGLAEALREGLPTRDRAREFEDRTRQLRTMATRTRDTVDVAVEKRRLNTRRLIGRSMSFEGHYYTVDALARTIEDTQSLARTLDTASQYREETDTRQRHWLQGYGALLELLAGAIRTLGELHSVSDVRDSAELVDAIDRAGRRRDELDGLYVRAEIGEPGPWPTVRALSTDAYRLVDDLTTARTHLVGLASGQHR